MNEKIKVEPKAICAEYKAGVDFKSSIGERGIYEQSRLNERFFVGDQWYGAKCGNERPLVRHNIIKRIGEYKMSMLANSPITVNYSADGVPNTVDMQDKVAEFRGNMIAGDELAEAAPEPIEVATVTAAMSDYFRTTAERLKFDNLKEQVLRNSFVSGTGFLFTYWDDAIKTGLYADEMRSQPITGDIACEVLDVENVNFGDPNCDDVQKQPYIIIAQRRELGDVRREARRNGQNAEEITPDKDDSQYYSAGDRGMDEPTNSRRVTVYTKLYKYWDKNGECKVMAVRCTENAYIRKPWDLKIKNYPMAKFCWERRRGSAYGESEITYLIPNQIAINRAKTAAVWSVMSSGMPIMLVNEDAIQSEVTNNPGQIIKVHGGTEDIVGSLRYVQPPAAAGQFQNLVNDMISQSLSVSGANEAALGDVRPDNAAAIIQMREAADRPMQRYLNRFFDFIEDVARIWADFWFNMYGNRSLKVTTREGTEYLPFNAERYQNLQLTAKVDVGATTIYSTVVVVSTLDNLLTAGHITILEYLERLPAGVIPDITGLIESRKTESKATDSVTDEEILASLQVKYPDKYQELMQMPAAQRAEILMQMRAGNVGAAEQGGSAI